MFENIKLKYNNMKYDLYFFQLFSEKNQIVSRLLFLYYKITIFRRVIRE